MRWHPAAEAILGGCQPWRAEGFLGFPGDDSGKGPTRQCRRRKRHGFDSWVRKFSWRRDGNPLQYSCLENPMDRGAWQATIHWLTKSQTQLKQLSRHACQGLSAGSTPSNWEAKSFIFKGGCGLRIVASTYHETG